MWFESLDQKQFMLYAQQSARLNTAYWLAVLTSHKCEEEEATPIVRAEIEGFKRQIALMLKHVRKDVRKQNNGYGRQACVNDLSRHQAQQKGQQHRNLETILLLFEP